MIYIFFWLKSANTDNKHPLLTSTKANTVPLAQKGSVQEEVEKENQGTGYLSHVKNGC